MACVPGVTLSPGFLALMYEHTTASIQHSTRVRLITGVDPMDTALMDTEARTWELAFRTVIPAEFITTGYRVSRPDGSELYTAAFSSPVAGTHAHGSGTVDYHSRTVTITGLGHGTSVGMCVGEALTRMFVGASFAWAPGEKFIARGADAALDALADMLDGSGSIWADFYGLKAHSRPTFPIQQNAHGQGRNGA